MAYRRVACFVVAVWTAAALAADPCGPELAVNSDLLGSHGGPAVAAAPGGGFLVVWGGHPGSGDDTDGIAIEARRFDAHDQPFGPQFQVNAYTTGYQSRPDVAPLPSGFVAVWSSDGSDDGDLDGAVIGRRLDPAGAPAAAEFRVNAYTAGYQRGVSVGADATGAFVVAWSSYGSPGDDADGGSIQGQRFDAAGLPVGTQFQVNTYTTGTQTGPSVAVDPAGGFVVAWTSFGATLGDYDASIQARRYDAAGAPLGDEFQVSAQATGYQYDVHVASDRAGGTLATWTREYDVVARRIDASGLPGPELVASTASTLQYASTATFDDAARYVVAWTAWDSAGTDHDFTSTQLRRFDADGQPSGPELQVNTTIDGRQGDPATASLGGADFVVAYSGYDIDDPQHRSRIWAQRFADPCITTTSTSTSSTTTTSRPTDLVAATRLLVKEGRRRHAGRVTVRLRADDPAIAPDAAGQAGDPTVAGGRVRLHVTGWNVDVIHELPASGWRHVRRGWRYRAGRTRAVVKAGVLRLAFDRDDVVLGATDPTPIEVAVEVGARRLCAAFGPGTAERSAHALRARRGSPPGACQPGLPP